MMETNIDTDDGDIYAYKENVIERQHGTIRLGVACGSLGGDSGGGSRGSWGGSWGGS